MLENTKIMTDQSRRIRKFGDFNLLKMLTQGSTAEIMLALKANQLGCKKYYIIKTLSDHIATNEKKLQVFVRECEIATSLSHENIVQANDYGTVEMDGKPHHYLSMNYIFGKNLSQVINQAKTSLLPVDIVCSVIYSVARALIHAHTNTNPISLCDEPIIHKDISPDNIIISYRGEIKLTDFGISLLGDHDSLPGKIAGKWGYMSPEQKKGVFVDRRTDIYSLGIVFWECLTGKKLFTPQKDGKVNKDISEEEIIHPSEINSKIPKEVGDICMKCLETSPKNRYQSAQELRNALIRCPDTGQFSTLRMKKYILASFEEEYKAESQALRNTLKEMQKPDPAPQREDVVSEEPPLTSEEVVSEEPSPMSQEGVPGKPLHEHQPPEELLVLDLPNLSPKTEATAAMVKLPSMSPASESTMVTASLHTPAKPAVPQSPLPPQPQTPGFPQVNHPGLSPIPNLNREITETKHNTHPSPSDPTPLEEKSAPELSFRTIVQSAALAAPGFNVTPPPPQFVNQEPSAPSLQQANSLDVLVSSVDVTQTDHERTAVTS